MKEWYSCPNCGQMTSDNFKNEFNKVECQKPVNRNGKLMMCGFRYFVNKYNTYDNPEGKRNGAKTQKKNDSLGVRSVQASIRM